MSDLSLLPSQAKFRAKRMRIKAKITNFLWIFSGIWMGLVILVVGIFLILKLVLGQTQKNYQKTVNQYKTLLGDMSVNQQVRYQAKIVGKVLADRFEYGETIELVSSLFGEEMEIKNFEIKGRNDFVITASVKNGEGLDKIEEIVLDINSGYREGFGSANISSVKFDPKNGWIFVVEVKLI